MGQEIVMVTVTLEDNVDMKYSVHSLIGKLSNYLTEYGAKGYTNLMLDRDRDSDGDRIYNLIGQRRETSDEQRDRIEMLLRLREDDYTCKLRQLSELAAELGKTVV